MKNWDENGRRLTGADRLFCRGIRNRENYFAIAFS
jgi:hypothetical protein